MWRFLSRVILGIFLVIGFGCNQKPDKVAEGPIRIGASMSLTGRFAGPGNYVHQGYVLWAKHVNARGGLLGRPVQLLISDDQSDPQTSVSLYQQLILQDRVDLVLSPVHSPMVIVASTVTEKLGYPMVALATSEKIWKRGYRYIFGMAVPAAHYFDGVLAIAQRQGLKRIALINENTVWAQSLAFGVLESAREMGLQIVFHDEWQKGTSDFRPLLARVKAVQPEILLAGGYFEGDVLITRHLKEVDFTPQLHVGTLGTSLDEFGTTLGQAAEYALGVSLWEPHSDLGFPGMQRFIEDFRKEFDRWPSGYAARGYAAGQIMEMVVTQVGSLDREKLRDALANLDTRAVLGRYKVDQDGVQIGHDVLLIQWQEGKKEIVWPEELATSELIFPTPQRNARQ